MNKKILVVGGTLAVLVAIGLLSPIPVTTRDPGAPVPGEAAPGGPLGANPTAGRVVAPGGAVSPAGAPAPAPAPAGPAAAAGKTTGDPRVRDQRHARNQQNLEAWKGLVVAHREKQAARRDAAAGTPPIGADQVRTTTTREDIARWDARARQLFQETGHLDTLPAPDQDRLSGRIKSLEHDIRYHPDDPRLYLDLVKVQEEARLTTRAFLTVNYALKKFPGNREVLLTRGKLYHAYGYRRQAEEAYEKLLELEPANGEVKGLLGAVQRDYQYHSGELRHRGGRLVKNRL